MEVAMNGKFVAYYRVSTDKQGKSGLGLDAQRQAVENYLNGGNWKLISEFTEVESGKNSDRPQLRAAQAACKKHKAKLVIAKLDRLSPQRRLHRQSSGGRHGLCGGGQPSCKQAYGADDGGIR
jgi:DNA invertase Pin-like site-specific DNA recombinase